jgi:hypothetical protein
MANVVTNIDDIHNVQPNKAALLRPISLPCVLKCSKVVSRERKRGINKKEKRREEERKRRREEERKRRMK